MIGYLKLDELAASVLRGRARWRRPCLSPAPEASWDFVAVQLVLPRTDHRGVTRGLAPYGPRWRRGVLELLLGPGSRSTDRRRPTHAPRGPPVCAAGFGASRCEARGGAARFSMARAGGQTCGNRRAPCGHGLRAAPLLARPPAGGSDCGTRPSPFGASHAWLPTRMWKWSTRSPRSDSGGPS